MGIIFQLYGGKLVLSNGSEFLLLLLLEKLDLGKYKNYFLWVGQIFEV